MVKTKGTQVRLNPSNSELVKTLAKSEDRSVQKVVNRIISTHFVTPKDQRKK